ncbi:MAG: MiaB/RimO family radical SAM methylthiotransferase [Kiritimatiellae bacterium]|nr:MiaB/RimO family radical SAM methylthiotransferase [Kiritimatiellia bacterium]MDD3544317.1 MiaB/RimO family radical SAM methylthiotransferase [Kiritimatiellia bacterium]MDD4623280.1 MiaB/RimO family radical SAM methylthiotransferase [Kiritimatiellia bacterium]
MRVSVKTSGCRLNRAESNRFEAEFTAAGCEVVPLGAACDIALFHTCVVTASAEKECMRLIRSQRKKTPGALLAVSGCATALISSESLRAAGADLIVPQAQKDEAVTLILRHAGAAVKVAPQATAAPSDGVSRALLKVQDGCDFFCSYCIVPHTRGRPRSLPPEDCLEKARALIDAGFQEIVVTGCNLACYRHSGLELPDLLSALATLPGLGRLRIGSVEPGTVELELARLMARTDNICHFLHLPIQSADDTVLGRMGRRYTSGAMAQAISEIIRLLPDVGLGTDIITGFPGETGEAFRKTRDFLNAFPFNNLHVFPYSERPGTPAAKFDGSVAVAERRERARDLIALGANLKRKDAFRRVDRPTEALVERFDKRGLAHGWSGEYLPCAIRRVPRDHLRKLVAFVPDRAEGETLCGALP